MPFPSLVALVHKESTLLGLNEGAPPMMSFDVGAEFYVSMCGCCQLQSIMDFTMWKAAWLNCSKDRSSSLTTSDLSQVKAEGMKVCDSSAMDTMDRELSSKE